MFRYAKQLGGKLGGLFRDESGQNVIETALIIGVVSLVLVLGFMQTNVLGAVTDIGEQVACEVTGNQWNPAAPGAVGGTCVAAP